MRNQILNKRKFLMKCYQPLVLNIILYISMYHNITHLKHVSYGPLDKKLDILETYDIV